MQIVSKGVMVMQVEFSEFLTNKKPLLKKMIDVLSLDYPYVSILGTDVSGSTYAVRSQSISINDANWGERGFVVRVHNGLHYAEFSLNVLNESSFLSTLQLIRYDLNHSFEILKKAAIPFHEYPIPLEEQVYLHNEGQITLDPMQIDSSEKIERLSNLKDKAHSFTPHLANFSAIYQEVKTSKLFLSLQKDLEQSWIHSEGYLVPIVKRDRISKSLFKGFSGLKGFEIITEMEDKLEDCISEALLLLDAEPVTSGEYDVICSPDVSGLIAHEAFGHGVEMDMFVKNRAKAIEYMNNMVASELVNMHDGAKSAEHVSSYWFDDEGTPGKDTVIIQNGKLINGISDLLSSIRLDINPTGNGKRQSYAHKAYTRMTNTFFVPGHHSLDEMIQSIDYGMLLESSQSGMEDPKNWGIQCVVSYAKEIKNGKLTGKIFSPIIMTGYVPDLLKSISMVSNDFQLFGTGACGKGYKEMVKVSTGGPYIKAKARLV
jgi:TldD protein